MVSTKVTHGLVAKRSIPTMTPPYPTAVASTKRKIAPPAMATAASPQAPALLPIFPAKTGVVSKSRSSSLTLLKELMSKAARKYQAIQKCRVFCALRKSGILSFMCAHCPHNSAHGRRNWRNTACYLVLIAQFVMVQKVMVTVFLMKGNVLEPSPANFQSFPPLLSTATTIPCGITSPTGLNGKAMPNFLGKVDR